MGYSKVLFIIGLCCFGYIITSFDNNYNKINKICDDLIKENLELKKKLGE